MSCRFVWHDDKEKKGLSIYCCRTGNELTYTHQIIAGRQEHRMKEGEMILCQTRLVLRLDAEHNFNWPPIDTRCHSSEYQHAWIFNSVQSTLSPSKKRNTGCLTTKSIDSAEVLFGMMIFYLIVLSIDQCSQRLPYISSSQQIKT